MKDRSYDRLDNILEPIIIIPVNFNSKDNAEFSPAKTQESTIKNTVDNNISIEKQSFDDDTQGTPSNSQIYEKIDRESFLSNKQTNNTLQDNSLYEIHLLSTTESFVAIDQTQTIRDEMIYNVTSAKCSVAMKKNANSFRISLTGKIQMNDSSNEPMLISIDAVPVDSPLSASLINNSAITTKSLNASGPIIEATHTDFPVDYSIIVHSLVTSSTTERLDYEINDTLETMSSDSRRQFYKSNPNREIGQINAHGKFFDLAAGSDKERRNTIGESLRIEKRLNKDNANSRTAQQIFLTDYSSGPSIVSRTNVARTSLAAVAATDETTDKLDSGLFANPIYFPDIFGSVLVRNDTVENCSVTGDVDYPCRVNRSDTTTTIGQTNINPVPLLHIRLYPAKSLFYDRTSDNRKDTRVKCCPDGYSGNATSGGCYSMPVTIRKLEFPETTPSTTSTLSGSQTSYSDSDPGAFKTETPEPSTNDWNAETTVVSLSTELQDRGVFPRNETLYSTKVSTVCGDRWQDESIDTIRMKNMMAILGFMMKLLRVIMKTDDSACTKIIHIEDTTMIIPSTRNVIVDSESRESDYDDGNERERNIVEERNISDKTIVTSMWTKQQDRTTSEWHSTTNVESIRVESLPYQEDESFTETPPVASTLLTTSDEVLKYEEGLSTLLESSATTTTERAVYVTVLSSVISTAKSKSFLFYEPGRKSFRGRIAPSKNTRVDLSVTRKNSNTGISCSDLEGKNTRGEKSHLDNNQVDCPFTRTTNGGGSSIDRSTFGKQTTAAHPTNSTKNSARIRRRYYAKRLPAMNERSIELRRSETTDVNNDRSILSLRKTDMASRNKSECRKKPGRIMTSTSDRQTARNGSSGDWIRKHRAIMQLPIDRKLQVSREEARDQFAIPSNKVTLHRYVRGRNAKHSRDRYPDDSRSDSFRIAGYNSGSMLRVSEVNDTLSNTSGELDLLVKATKERNQPTQYSSISSTTSVCGSSSCGQIVDKHINGYKRSVLYNYYYYCNFIVTT